ncbi:hypothetical protein WNZ14_13490 [Hoeflea sp. AS60]|uniref:hypothetical protein n=1 Tax=Hoeflea sp. AS60 TaxID=3135780 RepID=UPI003177BCD3
MGAARHAQALAGTLNVSMANAGIGFGAIIGAAAINGFGVASLGYNAAAIAICGIVAVPFVAHLSRRSVSAAA